MGRPGVPCWRAGRCRKLGARIQEGIMRRLIGWSGTVAVVGLLVLAVAAWGDDEKKADQKKGGEKKAAPAAEKIPLDKVPPKIMNAVKARFPGAELTSVEKETEDGK